VTRVQKADESNTRRVRTNGIGVLTKLMRAAETAPKRQSVTRSPRQAAIGGAILSGGRISASHESS